ncbi:hypothetical protein KI387_033575, partial [Taxus chinensis]
ADSTRQQYEMRRQTKNPIYVGKAVIPIPVDELVKGYDGNEAGSPGHDGEM